jgi:hypothetical protein
LRLGPNHDSAVQRATVHRRRCEALTDGSHSDEDGASSIDAKDSAGSSEEARFVRDALLRVISQVGGLLTLAQATGRLDLLDVRLFDKADTSFREAQDVLQLVTVLDVEPSISQLEEAAQFVGAALAAVRPLNDLATPLEMLTRAHRGLQGSSGNCCETAAREGAAQRGCACGMGC